MNGQEFTQQYGVFYYPNNPCQCNQCQQCQERQLAFNVYMNAAANRNNFCLLGRMDALNNIIGRLPNPPNAGQAMLVDDNGAANFYVTNGNQPGNVLRENQWTLGINDAWVVGGINGRSTFNFVGEAAIPLLDFNAIYLRGNGNFPVSVTAREIYGLMAAGYIPNIVNGMLVFSPPQTRDLTLFDFAEYHDAINSRILNAIFAYLEPVFQGAGLGLGG
ncbi:MAG: hypothetical protein LBI42_14240 [Chitinispirillales bacterium]|jgi:hypothetical protein|nr:hypothetical protein [Chitinispirillales bacterium]